METGEKRFSKAKWLESANIQMLRGLLTQREIDDACAIWVDELDGRTRAEVEAAGARSLDEAWFV